MVGTLGRRKIQSSKEVRQETLKNLKTNLSKLLKVIKENPDGFTVKLDGTPATKSYVVSPFKERETILDFNELTLDK